jgi:hypothetical protein
MGEIFATIPGNEAVLSISDRGTFLYVVSGAQVWRVDENGSVTEVEGLAHG